MGEKSEKFSNNRFSAGQNKMVYFSRMLHHLLYIGIKQSK
jgi:hypothetical protein